MKEKTERREASILDARTLFEVQAMKNAISSIAELQAEQAMLFEQMTISLRAVSKFMTATNEITRELKRRVERLEAKK